MAKWLTLVGVLALLTLGFLAYVKLRTPPSLERAEVLAHADKKTLAPLCPAPAFAFPDQRGVTVTTPSLVGKVWVANFIFTTCRTICPLLTAKMVQLQRSLKDVDVRFVSFSVDPEHDTPPVLAAYAQKWAPEERRWQLLSTDVKTLPSIAAGFHVTAEKNVPGEIDPIIHSSVFVLVDASGMVRGVFDSEHFASLGRGRARVIINAFHHFPPALAQQVLVGMAKDAPGVFISEGLVRNPLSFLAMTAWGIPALLAEPVLAHESRLSRAALTWLSPIALLASGWDGTVSTFRCYTREELMAFTAPLGDSWRWEFGTYRVGSFGEGSWFWGVPKK